MWVVRSTHAQDAALRDLSTIYLPSIGEWLWRRASRPVQRGVSYDVSISENEASRPVPTYT